MNLSLAILFVLFIIFSSSFLSCTLSLVTFWFRFVANARAYFHSATMKHHIIIIVFEVKAFGYSNNNIIRFRAQ